jgi:uncharacterized protein (UPF0335 family)
VVQLLRKEISMDIREQKLTWWAQSKIRNLRDEVERLELENSRLKKEIALSKNLKNFMVEGFDINSLGMMEDS